MREAAAVPSGYALCAALRARDLAPFLRARPEDPEAIVLRIYAPATGEGEGPAHRVLEIFPGLVGGEFHRTRGHHRSLHAEAGMTYPALVRVRAGEALLWQQRAILAPEAVSDFLICRVAAGQCALLLPDFAQGIVNAGPETLWADVVESRRVRHEHDALRAFGGPAYRPLARAGEVHWAANVNYRELTTPRWIAPRPVEALGLLFGAAAPPPAAYGWLDRPDEVLDHVAAAYDYLAAP